MDWDSIITAVIAAIPPSVVAAVAVWKTWQTHTLVNSRMSELLKISKQAAANAATIAEKHAENRRKRSSMRKRKNRRIDDTRSKTKTIR